MNTTRVQNLSDQQFDKEQYAKMAEKACGVFLDAALPGSMTCFGELELYWIDGNTLSIKPIGAETQIWVRVPGGEVIGVKRDQSREMERRQPVS
jgi:hypothetical protein